MFLIPLLLLFLLKFVDLVIKFLLLWTFVIHSIQVPLTVRWGRIDRHLLHLISMEHVWSAYIITENIKSHIFIVRLIIRILIISVLRQLNICGTSTWRFMHTCMILITGKIPWWDTIRRFWDTTSRSHTWTASISTGSDYWVFRWERSMAFSIHRI